MAIKTTEIRDKVQILKGTVQKQMVLHFFQTKKMLLVVVIITTTLFASIIAGRQHLLVSH